MESEKVKEIKKAWRCCGDGVHLICQTCPYIEKGCQIQLIKDTLTYINELESENESCHEVLADLKTIIKQQKNRIAELKKENAKLLDSVETVQNNRCTTKCELTEK